MSSEKYKYNLNVQTNNNTNVKQRCIDSTKIGETRRILQAKGRDSSFKPNRQNSTISTNNACSSQGVKRTQNFDNADQPPNKRTVRDYIPPKTTSYTSVGRGTKNLAARRMENLRKSLEIEKKNREYRTQLSSTKKSPDKVLNSPVSSDNERLKPKSLKCSYKPHYNSDGHFKRTRKYSSDDEISPSTSPVKHFSVQKRLENYQSSKSRTCSLNSSFVQSPVSISYAVKGNVDDDVPSIFNNNDRHESSSQSEEGSFDPMEWSSIDEETIVENINEIRKEINFNNLPVNSTTNNCDMLTSAVFNDGVFIVVDTNIFLSQLPFISRLRDTSFKGSGRSVIVVPWMVIQELDYMKESNQHKSLRKGAQKAVHYVNEQLASKHPQFKGQTVMEASKQDLSSSNPDDGILFCCMQLVQQGKRVTLLSNDVNLRNKALVNNVQAYNHTDLINNLNNLNPNTQNTIVDSRSVQKIKILLSNLLTFIIEKEMQNAYGNLWLKMAMMHPPFTTEEALMCLNKYWMTVFSLCLQKQCKQKVEEFISFMKSHRHGDNYHDSDFIKFVEYTLSLCIYLKNGYLSYRDKIVECILNIQKCAE